MDKHFAFIITALIERVRDFPPEALNELFRSMDRIEKEYDLIEPLTEEERLAIEEGLRSLERDGGIPAEEVFKEFKLDNYDRDAAGKEDFLDAISRVHKLSGKEQADVADVIFALLNEYRFDIPLPPPKPTKRRIRP